VTDDARAVEETVGSYFLGKDPDESLELVTGPLRDLHVFNRDIRPQPERVGFELRRLDVVWVHGDEAEVDLSAVGRYQATYGRRRRRWRASYSGPVRLRRVDGSWKVADYRHDGRSVLASIRVVTPEPLETDGIRIRPRCSVLHKRTTGLYFEVENRRSAPLELRGASSYTCYCHVTPSRVPHGERVVASVFWPKALPLRTSRIRGRLLARDVASGEPFDFAWRIELPEPATASIRRARPSLLLRVYGRIGDTGFITAISALGAGSAAAAGQPRALVALPLVWGTAWAILHRFTRA
jgi:hypothetical protein